MGASSPGVPRSMAAAMMAAIASRERFTRVTHVERAGESGAGGGVRDRPAIEPGADGSRRHAHVGGELRLVLAEAAGRHLTRNPFGEGCHKGNRAHAQNCSKTLEPRAQTGLQLRQRCR